eukprot:3971356-Pleurochrysis_carterae.AAC.3
MLCAHPGLSTKSTLLELAEIAKPKNHNIKLKADLKVKEGEPCALQTELAMARHEKALAVSIKELESKVLLGQLTEEAYEKGFARAMKNFKDVKELIGYHRKTLKRRSVLAFIHSCVKYHCVDKSDESVSMASTISLGAD